MSFVASRLPSFVLVALAMSLGTSPVLAQDAAGDGPAGRVDDAERIQSVIDSLRNPTVRRFPRKIRDRVETLIASDSTQARKALAGYLRDGEAPTDVVEQIVLAILVSSRETQLLPELLDRLRIEGDSELGRRFDEPLLRYAGTELVGRLAALARDASKAATLREAAIVTLGRSGHAAALPVLLELWDGPDTALTVPASRAFERILPGGTTLDEARAALDEMRTREIPLTELLRRRVRELARSQGEPVRSFEDDYRALAEDSLAHLSLDVLLRRIVVGSPLGEIRAAGARRVLAYDFATEPEATRAAARRAAGEALLEALLREERDDVDVALLPALVKLAPALRENVDEVHMGAIRARLGSAGRASVEVRLLALELLGELADPRAVEWLQDEYAALADTRPEERIAILDAMEKLPGSLTGWLGDKARVEQDPRVLKHLAVLLGKSDDAAATDALVEILRTRRSDEFNRVRYNAAESLGLIWSSRSVERARDALREALVGGDDVGRDPYELVRTSCAAALRTRGPGSDEIVVPDLARVVATDDETASVKEAAAKSILELVGGDAVAHLSPAFDDPAIWEGYRDHRMQELQRGELKVEDVVGEARALWAEGESRQPFAVRLLRMIIAGSDALWESDTLGRGAPREQLAEWLIAQGRLDESDGAVVVVRELVAAERRDSDPHARWNLLLARSLRATHMDKNVLEAAGLLAALRLDSATPERFGPLVRLELGDALLELGDPTGSLFELESIGDGKAVLTALDQDRLATLLAEAADASREELLRVQNLLDTIALGPGTAREEAINDLKELGFRAARHVRNLLTDDVAPAARDTLLTAATHLVGRSFQVSSDDDIAQKLAEVRAALDALVNRARRDPR